MLNRHQKVVRGFAEACRRADIAAVRAVCDAVAGGRAAAVWIVLHPAKLRGWQRG